MTRIAAATYPLDWFDGWPDYEAKMRGWVSEAAGAGADILLFPEYGAMELASLSGVDPADLDAATAAVADNMACATGILSDLARAHGVHVVAPSGPVRAGDALINRAHFLWPDGRIGHQDKQIMTPWEISPWRVAGHGPLRLFDTDHGRIAILVCYDCEFPLLARKVTEAGADLILVPSATETVAGYHRVRIGAMARALEGQCFTAMASVTGPYPIEAVDVSHGAGGIFCPPDVGLPETGIVACGALDKAGWTYGDIDLAALTRVREEGGVRLRADWPLQEGRQLERP
ncbi:hydrolase, carbon-nitrogen family protein [Pseudooceanicola batsensis HTCC2597]|uniref:Hydrolase, carbon-nitrogen family protein n=1 Tax=Pseudooceanicola batsensis (strain ATCC BAA-863 / DSM 15984 / KCTC 12145 / HTCC2597) TaxID=252305 RepID=A3TUL0_PSEBH|nr:nitrilase-related carbon-nitrogen hydrolase [Pseudooceanicola batsensis]EAQ04206.1 hydrolase, carbon-nitrogen family protein [Pseudooceanicola batsensis HTCC2597]